MNKIYFGEVPIEYLEVDYIDYFNYKGKYYYYSVSLEGDTLKIEDTIGRYVPFDVEEIHELAKVTTTVGKIHKAKAEAEEFYNYRVQEALESLKSLKND